MEITAAQFGRIEGLLPVQRGNVRVTNLQVVNAIIHVTEHSGRWRALPKRFGNWHTIYTRANRWAKAGVLDRVLDELRIERPLPLRTDTIRRGRSIAKGRSGATGAATTEGMRAERARAAILAAAEDLFAKRGYAATRLEDVADAVGVTRPALFHYFPDKKALFDAVLKDAFGSLVGQLEQVLDAEQGSIGARIEQAVAAWVDAIVARPALARLILRFAADGPQPVALGAFFASDRIQWRFWSLFDQGRRSGEIKPLHDDPFHAASAIIGTTVFFVAALAALVPHGRFEPLDPGQVAAHKHEAIHTARRLLGIADRPGGAS